MKTLQVVLLIVLTISCVLLSINLYKYYGWVRVDVINVATLSASVIAIVALIINLSQFLINKDKRLFEIGEFRLEKYYKPKIARIEPLNVLISFNVTIVNKGRGYQLNGENLHYLQHKFIEYLKDVYNGQIPTELIYLSVETNRTDEIYLEFLNTLKSFHEGIHNGGMKIFNYHRQYLSIINDIRKDKNISKDQKTSFLSTILLKELLGYNMMMTGRATNNFKLISSLHTNQKISYTTIGYLDVLREFLPNKKVYDKSLGEFKNIFEQDLPK